MQLGIIDSDACQDKVVQLTRYQATAAALHTLAEKDWCEIAAAPRKTFGRHTVIQSVTHAQHNASQGHSCMHLDVYSCMVLCLPARLVCRHHS